MGNFFLYLHSTPARRRCYLLLLLLAFSCSYFEKISTLETAEDISSSIPELDQEPNQGPIINFNNVSIIEFLRFASRLTERNFIFDPADLQFPVANHFERPPHLLTR